MLKQVSQEHYTAPIVLDNASTINPIEITVQTAGNRSMLGNDFTQVNDLGYGLIVTNGALSRNGSQFTYYCWTAYYANNGGEIRSFNGSNAYGEYGLVANGSDPKRSSRCCYAFLIIWSKLLRLLRRQLF